MKLKCAFFMATSLVTASLYAGDSSIETTENQIFFLEPLRPTRFSTYPNEHSLREKRGAIHVTRPRGQSHRKNSEAAQFTSLTARRGAVRRAFIGNDTMIREQRALYVAITTQVAGEPVKPKIALDEKSPIPPLSATPTSPSNDMSLNPPLSEIHRQKGIDRDLSKAWRVANMQTLPRRSTAGDTKSPTTGN